MRPRLAAVLLMFLLVSACGRVSSSSPQSVAADFYNRIGRMNLPGALQLVSTEGRGRYGDAEIMRILTFMGGLSAFQGGIRVEQARVLTQSTDRASVLVTGGYPGAEEGNWGVLALVREGGAWKVDIEPFMPLTRGLLHGIDTTVIADER